MVQIGYTYIGSCSLCGGDVTVPQVWGGLHIPLPTCENCGATKKKTGPIIQMEKEGAKQ